MVSGMVKGESSRHDPAKYFDPITVIPTEELSPCLESHTAGPAGTDGSVGTFLKLPWFPGFPAKVMGLHL